MKLSDWSIWLAAGVLSLSLHLLLFVDSGSKKGAETAPKQQVTSVSFRSVAAPLTPPQNETETEQPETPPEEVVEAPEPPPKPVVKEKPKRAEKVRQVKPPKPDPEPVVPSTPTSQVAEKPQHQESQGSVDDPALLEQAKNEYLRRLMAHIESHKHYPRVARRRGIQGDVSVSFTLQQGGALADLVIQDGHRILRKAVEEAVHAAKPLPVPPPSMSLPYAISFSMEFSLTD